MGNAATSTMRHPNSSTTQQSANPMVNTQKVKPYRHYSADWVLSDRGTYTQTAGTDPLLLASLQTSSLNSTADTDGDDSVYVSGDEYDSDVDIDELSHTNDTDYVNQVLAVDDYSRTEQIKPSTHQSNNTTTAHRSRAKLARVASGRSIGSGKSSHGSHKNLVTLDSTPNSQRQRSTGTNGSTLMSSGGGTISTFPLHVGDCTVVLALERDDIGLADKSWRARTYEPIANDIDILISFMSGVCTLMKYNKKRHTNNLQCNRLLLSAHECLLDHKQYRDVDIHSLVRNDSVLQAYMQAKYTLMSMSADELQHIDTAAQLAPVKESALLYQSTLGHTRLAGQFGGQGYNWLIDFTYLYQTYQASHVLFDALVNCIHEQCHSIEAQSLGLYNHGVDVYQWIHQPDSKPSLAYLTKSPISYPFVAVTQLAQYYVTCLTLDIQPSDFNRHFIGGFTGHSQGIISAVVASTSNTLSEFITNSISAIKLLFWHGARVQQIAPLQTVPFKLLQESLSKSFGQPTPMLSVRGLNKDILQQHIDTINSSHKPHQHIYISLINAPDNIVVSGLPVSLHQLRLLLSSIQADSSVNQNRIPFKQRKLVFTCRYLPVSVPFHSPLIESAIPLIVNDAKRLNIELVAQQLFHPVYHTCTGVNLQQSSDLITELITMQCSQPVNWQLLCQTIYVGGANTQHTPAITHVIDFGVGGVNGAGRLTFDNVEGSGCHVITMDSLRGNEQISGKAALYDSRDSHIPHGVNWVQTYGPKLKKISHTQGSELSQQYTLETRFTQVYNKPVVMVPGMTPCTVGEQFVSSIAHAGYHVELAGGGQHTEQIMRDRVDRLTKLLPAGMGFTINLLFLNAYLWKFQFPLVIQLRREGYPIDGITIGAGVPSPDMSDDILQQLRSVGIYNMGLKPGSIESITAVRDIAIRNPQSNIILQWTGGRAGGHHSCEDQHQPMLDTYSSLRQVKNIVLVVGGGIGDTTSAMNYLTGTWSTAYGRQAMPFDAVMCGSRVMIAKECPTATSVKQLIASVEGVPDEEWETSFDINSTNGAGGVITILSELGEPIHKISNRGTRLWRHFDNTYFNLPRDKIDSAVKNDRVQIVDSLNSDFQKPFFGRRHDGTVVYDIREMTYTDVAYRMCELMYCAALDENTPGRVKPVGEPEWIDITYQMRFNDWLLRCAERFANAPTDHEFDIFSLLSSGAEPHDIIQQLDKQHPQLSTQTITPEDSLYFISLSKRPGKPVNYIPIIDGDLKFWLKKDSLWFSEDLRTVPEHDAQRVAILQGPVATQYSKQEDEPVQSILDGINHGIIKQLYAQYESNNQLSAIETQSHQLTNASALRDLLHRYQITPQNYHTRSNAAQLAAIYQQLASQPEQLIVALNIPDSDTAYINDSHWLQIIAGLENGWRRAMLLSPMIMRDSMWSQNVLSGMFKPKPGQTITLSATSTQSQLQINRIRIYDNTLVALGLQSNVAAVELSYNDTNKQVDIVLRHPRSEYHDSTTQQSTTPVAELQLHYTYVPYISASVYGVLCEQNWSDRCAAVLAFYKSLWLDSDTDSSSTIVLSGDEIRRFKAAIGDTQLSLNDYGTDAVIAPIDYSIVVAWESICQSLMNGLSSQYGAADLLSLVHLSNEFIVVNHSTPLKSADRCQVTSKLYSVWDDVEGRVITVHANIKRQQSDSSFQLLQTIVSRFAIPPRAVVTTKQQKQNLFRTTKYQYTVKLTDVNKHILLSKQWHNLNADQLDNISSIKFDISTVEKLSVKQSGRDVKLDISCTGTITTMNNIKLADVNSTGNSVLKDVVVGYLQRYGVSLSDITPLSQPQYYPIETYNSVHSNALYAITSKDVNPIHTNTYTVALASLPATIVHGMHTSAKCRQLLSKFALGGSSVAYIPHVNRYKAQFMGMILPNMKVTAQTSIVAMYNGSRVLSLELRDQYNGQLLMKATGHIEQPSTAYLFTGQGSAVVGMGMQLYDKLTDDVYSTVRSVWNTADEYFIHKYGFSILQIVRDNPKTLTVSLYGERGHTWRMNYQRLTVNKPNTSGTASNESIPLFPESHDNNNHQIVFRSVDGLLFQTQFQQPAILLTEKSFYEYMKLNGCVGHNTVFAGHSLGEYGAVGCLLDSMSIAQLAEVVFLRGLTMQSAVPRDEHNRSRYGMIAVSPIRVNPWFNEQALEMLINLLVSLHPQHALLQIVNYNTLGTQYVAAGHLTMLESLRVAIDNLSELSRKMMKSMFESQYGKSGADDKLKSAQKNGWPSDMPPLPLSEEEIKQLFHDIAQQAIDSAMESEKQASDSFIPLKRGSATIPLVGIDVPFHSKLLVDGVPTFRLILQNIFNDISLDPQSLINRYIPNLLGIPFELTHKFVQQVYNTSESPYVQDILSQWSDDRLHNDNKYRESLCKLLLVELLAYQFASPVQWITTQASLVDSGIRRFIEIGPSPVLTTMLKRGVAESLGKSGDGVELLWSGRDEDKINGADEAMSEAPTVQWDNEKEQEQEQARQIELEAKQARVQSAATPQSSAPAAAPVQPSTPAPSQSADAPVSTGKPADSVPLSVLHSTKVIIGMKLKLAYNTIDSTKTVRNLSGGKSAIQNEILGDLSAEFKTEPEGADELPLTELASKLGSNAYKQPGKVLSAQISSMNSRSFPGAFGSSKAKEYLRATYGVDDSTIHGIQVHCLTMMPAARLAGEAEVTAWLDSVVQSYAAANGVSLNKKSSGSGSGDSGSGSGGSVAAIDPKEMLALKKMLSMQADLLHAYATAGSKSGVSEVDNDVVAKEKLYIDTIDGEYGSKYVEGIRPVFDSMKQRDYDSNWNWNRLHTVQLFTKLQRIIDENNSNQLSKLSDDIQYSIQHIANRATQQVLDIITTFNQHNQSSTSSVTTTVLQYTQQLQRQVQSQLNSDSVYRELSYVTLPVVSINDRGDISMTQKHRYSQAGYEPFVADMISNQSNDNRYQLNCALPVVNDEHQKLQSTVHQSFLESFQRLASSGLSFKGKTVLITGAGEGSIGAEIMRCMLSAGAWVIVTTSRPTPERWSYYRGLYKRYGGKSSKLTVLPYNAGSVQDTDQLIEYLFDSKGLGLQFLDYCIPFAAMSEQGRDVTRIDSMSELAHRAMLINVHRLIGNIVNKLNTNGASNNNLQTLVILPMSPNHGVFGGDGLYAESKIGLETLYKRWKSESWNNVISLIGVEIGWTRGTGLMNANDIISSDMEQQTGLRTFDTTEMAFSIVGLLDGHITTLASRCPLHANYTGGFHKLSTGVIPSTEIRNQIQQKQLINKSIYTDYTEDVKHTGSQSYMLVKQTSQPTRQLQPRSQLKLSFPPLQQTKPTLNEQLSGMLDLRSVVVCVGYGEVGPHGSSRTRWEYELNSKFSMEGCIELARSMKLIKFDPNIPSWVDAKDNKAVSDIDISNKYLDYIMSHVGIREIEPELFNGYNPTQKLFLQQIAVEADMPPFEVSSTAEVEHLLARHGNHLEIITENDRQLAKLKSGATIYIPKYREFTRLVAGQIPTGWNASSYGIPSDLQNVDPVTLYALAATIDAFASAGISDPYEIYKYCHVSEVGNSAGGGMGGMESMKSIFRYRFMDQPNLASDLLQETFINTTPAWINMLLLSSSGPIKTPVAACATAAVSVEIAVDTIRSGKAKLMIAGGFEDFGEEGSYEFAQMNATSNSVIEYSKGRPASEHSRPATTTRAGFMESQGAGIQLLCTAELAIQMGLPIYAIIAGTSTATDRQGRSVPAPGRGILTTARELTNNTVQRNNMLDISYRRRQLQSEMKYLESLYQSNVNELGGNASDEELNAAQSEHSRRVRLAQQTWSHNFALGNPSIAPLRASLAVYGLTVDDLEAVSFHGTSTKANDKNESAVIQAEMTHLGRTAGKPLFTIFQKWLTGHPKGSAAAWMLNGLIQSMQYGIVPGNKNLDNTSAELESNTLLIYSDENIELGRQLKAAYLHSFGFGQAGAQVIIVNPQYLYSALDTAQYKQYVQLRQSRELRGNQHWCEYMLGEHTLVPIAVRAPYNDDDAESTYLNPLARAEYSKHDKQYTVHPKNMQLPRVDKMVTSESLQSTHSSSNNNNKQLQHALQQSTQSSLSAPSQLGGLGIDMEEINNFTNKSPEFIKRNYSESEINYCRNESSNESASLAGIWCAKESIIKALSSYADSHHITNAQWKSSGSALIDVEIQHHTSGSPHVLLHGYAAEYAKKCGIDTNNIVVSISHTATQAVAQSIIKQ